jgi:hypothetical protein
MTQILSNRKRNWLYLSIALLLAIFFSAAAKTAWAACTGTPNPYCSGGCCYATKRVSYVNSCSPSANNTYCVEGMSRKEVECPYNRAVNCQTETYDIGDCPSNRVPPSCGNPVYRANTGTCCGGSGPQPTKKPTSRPPNPTATQCIAAYELPTAFLSSIIPPYPIVFGQDPDKEGVNLSIGFLAGQKTNSCPGNDYADLTLISLNEVNLTPETVAWIAGELAVMYPGAEVRGAYPLHPNYTSSMSGRNGSIQLANLEPLDPGDYLINVTATQSDGKTITVDIPIHVSLFETTLTQP